MSAAGGRWRRILYVACGLLVAGGLCTLRVRQVREEQAEQTHRALRELGRAVDPSESDRDASFARAYAAARDAARASSLILDSYASFLLTAVEDLREAAREPVPGVEEPTLERVRGHTAHGELEEARRLLESTLEQLPERDAQEGQLRLWLRLVRDLQEVAAAPE